MNKISLRKVRLKDKVYFLKWWRDKELISLTSGDMRLMSALELNSSFLSLLNSKNESHFVIIVDSKVIGHISLSKQKDQWQETQIVIGEKDYWNQGYGSQAIKNLIGKINKSTKIYLEVRPDNLRAIKAYEKSGFKKVKLIKYPNNKNLPETLRMELVIDDESPV